MSGAAARSPWGSRRTLSVVVVVATMALLVGAAFLLRPAPPSQQTTGPPRSGPISTYPASWGVYSSCPGFSTQANTTTLPLGKIDYPGSWNTTTIVTLGHVYDTMINAPAFRAASAGDGWVVYSWYFSQGGSNNPFPGGDTIVGLFILTNGFSPVGYVWAYYNIMSGAVALGTVTVTVTVNCPTQ